MPFKPAFLCSGTMQINAKIVAVRAMMDEAVMMVEIDIEKSSM